jgi:hypothetical protein
MNASTITMAATSRKKKIAGWGRIGLATDDGSIR